MTDAIVFAFIISLAIDLFRQFIRERAFMEGFREGGDFVLTTVQERMQQKTLMLEEVENPSNVIH